MPKIEIEGLTIHYQQLGEGPDIVLLHGLSGDLAFWHPTVMTGLAAGHRVTLLDFRGHGRSGTPPSGYTTRDLAGDVADLFIGLDLRRAHVVGHSYGGAVALHLAALHPDRVVSLVLADARVRSLQRTEGVQDWQHWERIRSWLSQRGVEIAQGADPDFGLMEELARCRIAGKLDGISAGPFFVPFSAGSSRRAEKWLKL
ncbi:MAG TPA: alpha/beta fold hydrolase, partial [Candidatus Polarisedimenticolia bacterium]|nr:alpha/beta fold hydrolase [Candidatus Polarisedimenticolia bacterium]